MVNGLIGGRMKSVDTIIEDKLVLVFSTTYNCYGLRELTKHGQWYDENNNLDDSEIEWEFWSELPKRP